ncbi:MAG: DUF3368 domain-containing protein [Planctomycetaceae bacterium]|nr:DUF3368 domain-containing protein [Planctomycetaceae bacterium]
MTVVVSDSPIRALNWLGLLPLLQQLYGDVLIPPTVARELETPRRVDARVDLTQFPFLVIQSPADDSRVQELMIDLDAGESEAIALAEERDAMLLVDDASAREVAGDLGLATVGTLRVLLLAKEDGYVPAVKPLMTRLIDELGFFVSRKIYDAVLEAADESNDRTA